MSTELANLRRGYSEPPVEIPALNRFERPLGSGAVESPKTLGTHILRTIVIPQTVPLKLTLPRKTTTSMKRRL